MGEPTIAEGTLLAGKFRVLRCLGEGGMGAVYEIEHELTKHRRALKLLHPFMTVIPGVVERFLREASAAGRVGNRHIIETFDAGSLDTGEPYIVMELLQGEPLSQRIARGPLSVPEMVNLIGQTCHGVAAAHAAGIVHRDLKPDNIFVTQSDGQPFVKILDFGISKFESNKTEGLALTKEGAALGTPYYMSPEQIHGLKDLDARADVYALGVILYECASGIRPYDAELLTQLAVLIHTGKSVPLQVRRPDLPPAFAELVHAAMAPDRAQRIASVAELAAGLARFGAIAFSSQRPPSMLPSPPMSVFPARSLATSGVGVSMRSAPPQRKSSAGKVRLAIVGGAAVLAGLVLALRGVSVPAPPPAPEPSQQAKAVQAPVTAAGLPGIVAPVSAPPALPSTPPLAREAAAPTPASPSEHRAVTVAPALSASASARVAAPVPPVLKSGRADERGLAKDNPFR
jgi:eukaryotic-like serine/threonine-protein kinase